MKRADVQFLICELTNVSLMTAETLGCPVTMNVSFCKKLVTLAEDYLKLEDKCERLKEEKDILQTALDIRDAHDFEALSLKLYNGEMKDPRGVKFTPEFNSDLAFYFKNRKKKGEL